jgi:hypothetical protein
MDNDNFLTPNKAVTDRKRKSSDVFEDFTSAGNKGFKADNNDAGGLDKWNQRKSPSPAKRAEYIPQLSEEQMLVLEEIMFGKNIFFTGSAGTGKSTLLKEIIRRLPRDTTFITAATGVAATNIGGTTLHSFAGIGLGEDSKVNLATRVMSSRSAAWWKRAKVLIIDEVSMIDAELFDKLDFVARVVRGQNKPFGGIQLICSGDFFQLPPVRKRNQKSKEPKSDGAANNFSTPPGDADKLFCFESKAWSDTITCCIELKQVFRQKDMAFVRMLNQLRHGICTEDTTQFLMNCINKPLNMDDDVEPTKLFTLNRDVDKINEERLDSIPAKGKLFKAKDRGEEPFLEQLKHCVAPEDLKLKVGAQVMLIINLDRGLVNGSRGVVIGFDETRQMYPRVRFVNGTEETIEPHRWAIEIEGREVASRYQIPLKLAWAMSIHKSQGQTLDKVEIKLDNVFEYGQAYVALSRVSSPQGLKLLAFNPRVFKAHPMVTEFYKTFDPFANAGKDSGIVNASPYKPDKTYQTNAVSFKIPASQQSASNGTPSSTPTLTPSFWATAKNTAVAEEKPTFEDEDTTSPNLTPKKEPVLSPLLQQVFGSPNVTPVKSPSSTTTGSHAYEESQSFFSAKKKPKVEDDPGVELTDSGKKTSSGKKPPVVPIVIDIDDDETTIGSSATTTDIMSNLMATPIPKKGQDDDSDLTETDSAIVNGRNFKKSDSFHGLQSIPDVEEDSASIRDLIMSEAENKSPVPAIDTLMQHYDNLDDSFEQEEPSTPVKKQAKPVSTASLTASPPFIRRQNGKDIWDTQATPATGKKKNSPTTASTTPKYRVRRTNKSEAAVSAEAAAADDTLTPFMSKRRKENREDEGADLTPRKKSRSPKSDSLAPTKLKFTENDDF